MSPRWEKSAGALLDDLKRVFAARLLSVVAYGPAVEDPDHPTLTALALVSRLSYEDLDACAGYAARWARVGVETPLILPTDEFHRSLDTFALEYTDILATHALLYGADPFSDLQIHAEDVRRACEKQAKSQLLHLRQGYIEAHGNPLAIARLVSASAPAFAALLRSVARLLEVVAPTGLEASRAGALAVGLDSAVVNQVLTLTNTSATKSVDGARLFPAYLSAVERLAHAVDTWRQ